jgi:glyoxalase family protein
MTPITGLHHVTAIASNPQANLDFYTQVLGLRLVKKTVNFDDPGTYHFYFGDDAGTPGTILTFFPWPGARRGLAGAGEVTHTAFSVPRTSISYWQQRLTEQGILVEHTGVRFAAKNGGEDVLTFADPDGMKLELVGHSDVAAATNAPRYSDVPAEHSIRGFFGVTMLHRDAAATKATLAKMGFTKTAEEGNRLRFASAAGTTLGNAIDIVVNPGAGYGRNGAGSVHHIAFRTPTDETQLEWREKIAETLAVTTVQDREYFHSIYFREPGGVLFEMATDAPGFAIDEPIETLGEALRIPPWFESQRAAIEQRLIPVTLTKAQVTA